MQETKSYLFGRDLALWVESSTFDERRQARSSLYHYLRSDRLENYGYDPRDFRRLQSQRQRVKRALSSYTVGLTDSNGRLGYDPKTDTWHYVVGQSRNEEITNLIAYLTGYRARGWLS